jgi:hypothetical protein
MPGASPPLVIIPIRIAQLLFGFNAAPINHEGPKNQSCTKAFVNLRFFASLWLVQARADP